MRKRISLSDRAGIIVVGNLANSTLSIGLALVLVRTLSQSQYGAYAQAFLLYNTLASLFLIGLPESLYYFIPLLSPERRKALVIQTYLFTGILGVLFGVALFLGRGFVAELFHAPALISVLVPFALFVATALPTFLLRPIMIALDQHRTAAFGGLLSDISVQAAILLQALRAAGLHTIFVTAAIVGAFRLIVLFGYTLWLLRDVHLKWDRQLFTDQVKYSGPLGFSNLISLFSGRLDSYVVSSAYSPEAFAVYNVGARELPLVDMVTYSVASVLMPHLARLYAQGKKQEFLLLWHESIRKVALIILPLFVFFMVFADSFVQTLYTKRYAAGTLPFLVFLFLLPLRVTAYGPTLRSMGLTKPIIGATIFSGIISLVLNLGLCWILGFIGPAIAFVLTAYILASYFLLLIRKHLSVSVRQLMPWGVLARIIGLAVIAVLPALLARLLLSAAWQQLLGGTLLFVVAFYLLARAKNVVTDADQALIRRWVGLRSPIFVGR